MPSDQKTYELKAKEGKVDYTCMPLEMVQPVARVFMKSTRSYGGKYDKHNYRHATDPDLYHSAILRHLHEYFHEGVRQDPDTGESPLDHVIASCMILKFVEKNTEAKDDTSDKGRG